MKPKRQHDRQLISLFLILAGMTLLFVFVLNLVFANPMVANDWVEMATK